MYSAQTALRSASPALLVAVFLSAAPSTGAEAQPPEQSLVELGVGYKSDFLSKIGGGLGPGTATAFRGHGDITAAINLAHLPGMGSGRLLLNLQSGHGDGLTEAHIGDFQVISNIDAHDFFQLSEWWWEGSPVDGLTVRIGKQDANSMFAVLHLGSRFVHSSFGYHPTIPMPTFPHPGVGASAQIEPWADGTIRLGAWDGAPDGSRLGLSGTGTTFAMAEFELRYRLSSRRPGDFHLGLWHHTRTPIPTPGPAGVHRPATGFHFEWEQILFGDVAGPLEMERGLGVFLQYGQSPSDRSEAHRYAGAGAVWSAPFGMSPGNSLGVGVARLEFGQSLGPLTPETAVELFYSRPLLPGLTIQADVLYVDHPGGIDRNALVFGFRIEAGSEWIIRGRPRP